MSDNNKHCMSQENMEKIKNVTLAPYIQLSVSLIDKPRQCLSNMFRHAFSTLAILIDYGYTDSVLLKASVIHDVIEDIPNFDHNEIKRLDEGNDVLGLVLEVTKRENEKKDDFLTRIANTGSFNSKVLKCADRISNLHDLGFTTNIKFINKYVIETEKYIIPIAETVNKYMLVEINDLVKSRKNIAELYKRWQND